MNLVGTLRRSKLKFSSIFNNFWESQKQITGKREFLLSTYLTKTFFLFCCSSNKYVIFSSNVNYIGNY